MEVLISLIIVAVGLTTFFVGMVIVGTGTRYLNMCKRELTPLEEWTLASMNGIHNAAQQSALANNISQLTPGVTDDMLSAISSRGIVMGLFSVGGIYTGNNALVKHWPVCVIALIIAISGIATML